MYTHTDIYAIWPIRQRESGKKYNRMVTVAVFK